MNNERGKVKDYGIHFSSLIWQETRFSMRTQSNNTKGSSGFSIAEVMVVMIVVSVAIVGVFGLVHSGVKLTTLTENRITALNLARE